MKKALKIVGMILGLLLISGVVVYFFFPQKLVNFTNAQNASSANLKAKTIFVNDYEVHYYTNENTSAKDTIVLLHGLGDDKNSFVQSAKYLTDDYYIIMPDLLASGENAKTKDLDVSILGQVEFIHSFLNQLNIKKINLVGNSMGGHISAAYAIAYPDQIKSLILLNAAGLKIDDHVVYTGFGEEIKNEEDLQAVLTRVFYRVPELPGPVKKLMIAQINNSRDFLNNTIIPQIKNGAYFDLKEKLGQIKAPTLILWGKHDEVVKFKVAERFHQDIPISKIEIIENAAHSPQLEVPEIVANNIHNFILNKMQVSTLTTRKQHLAKTQLYRWYQLYEREMNQKRIDNQMDILTEDVLIKSAMGEMKGRENYPERLSVYEGWKNAHHVENVKVVLSEDEILNLEADIRYQNIQPGGEKKSYTIHYNTTLEQNDGNLPKFKTIEIAPTGETQDTFKDAYPVNRTKSLMHYWLASMESLDGNVEPFKELLTDDFVLNFSTTSQITSIEELETWLNGTPTQLKESSHYPENFSVKTILENEYEVEVEFDWKGTTKDGKQWRAKTKHIWYVVDNPSERFARILKADVTQVELLREVK